VGVLRFERAALARDDRVRLERSEWQWDFSQTLVDGDDANDWAIAGTIDLEGSRLAGKPILVVKQIVSP
jgi:hypothetical protein